MWFRGDQSQGIISGRDFNIWTRRDNIFVEDLSKNISPATGPAISLKGTGAGGEEGGNSSMSGWPWDWHGARNDGAGAAGPGGIWLIYRGNNNQIRPGVQGEGISVLYEGGRGGDGGNANVFTQGGNGGAGGNGIANNGQILVNSNLAKIFTQGAAAEIVKSVGGNGGNGGSAESLYGHGGSGGKGGEGGEGGYVSAINNNGVYFTNGDNAPGMEVASVGGRGAMATRGSPAPKATAATAAKGAMAATLSYTWGIA
jgi:hypothetical protein